MGVVVSVALIPRINHAQDGLDTVRVVGAGPLLSQPAHHTEGPGQMFLQILNDRQLLLLLSSVLGLGAVWIFVGRTVGLVGGIGGVILVLLVLLQPAAV